MRQFAIFCLLFPMLACQSTNRSEVKDVDAAGTDDRKYSIVCPIPQSDQCKHSRQDWEHEGMCVREARVSANGNDHSATIFLSQDKSIELEVLRPDREIKLTEQVEKVSGGKLAWVIASDELDFSNGTPRPIPGDTWIQINVDRSSSERKIIGSLAIGEDFGFLDFACHEAGGSGSIPDGIAPASPVVSNSRFPSGEVSWACNNGNSTVLFFESDTNGGAVAISNVSSRDPNESSPGGDDGLPGNVRPTTQHEACQALDESSGFGISCKSPTLSLKVLGSKKPTVDTSFDATVSRNNIQRNLSCIGRASH